MTFTSAEERRVARLESDVESLYELVSDVQRTQGVHTEQLAQIHTTLQEHSRILRKHDKRFEAIDARFDRIDGRLDGVDSRFDRIDGRLDTIDASLAEILRRLPEAS